MIRMQVQQYTLAHSVMRCNYFVCDRENIQDLVAIYNKNAVARFNKGTKVKSSSVSNESASMTV